MFARLRVEGRLALIAYLTVGYPRPALTPAGRGGYSDS